jgi:hypothetical protein
LDSLQGNSFDISELDFFEVPEINDIGISQELGERGS